MALTRTVVVVVIVVIFCLLSIGVQGEYCKPNPICKIKKEDSLGVGSFVAYPGYNGPHVNVKGSITVRHGQDGQLMLKLNGLRGLAPDCVGCGLHIHAGTSCIDGDNGAAGPHYWQPTSSPDPWNLVGYDSNSKGESSNSVIVLSNGFGYHDHVGRSVVIHDAQGTRMACGILEEPTFKNEPIRVLRARVGAYPGYAGANIIGGMARVTFYQDDSFRFSMSLTLPKEEAPCVKCGVHIHEGYSCDTDTGPHYWNKEGDRPDPWSAANFTYYNADEYGNGKANFFLDNGISLEGNVGRTITVHAQDGRRIGCGVLEPIG